MNTAQIAKSLNGNKLYQIRARAALPLLVKQASARSSIYYSDLAKELDMPNPRNLNYVLGSIGTALAELSKVWGEDIPVLQCIVVNKQHELPGEGIGWFIKNRGEFSKLSLRQKRNLVEGVLAQVYAYPRWNDVLVALGLEPITDSYLDVITSASQVRGGSGESEAHLKLKQYIARNPQLVGLPKSAAPGEMEARLPSGDVIDVLFKWKELRHAVEVKSHLSTDTDIVRGLFQCIKYTAVLRASISAENSDEDATSTLVLGCSMPNSLIRLGNLLGIEVIDNVETQILGT